jgi:uncharacterized protein (TIGR00159 family)
MQWLININLNAFIWWLDVFFVLALVYLMLAMSSDRRTLLMVRGFIILLIVNVISTRLEFKLLSFVLDKLLVGAALAMAVIFQSELRRFLEQLGRGEILLLLRPVRNRRSHSISSRIIDELIEAVVELSQNRTGALMILETSEPIEERDFPVPGVRINAELTKELLQTIFQTSTLLHDGAVWLRGDRVIAAGVILPLSDRAASREIGTRHRAAMGITERINACFCIVVSEETGSIAIAENGILDRPITSAKLREILEDKFASSAPTTLVGTVPRFGWLWRLTGLGTMFKRKLPLKK